MEELEIIHSKEVPGIRILLTTVDYRCAHFHPEWELITLLNAPLQVLTGEKSFVAAPGDVVLFSPNVPHEFRKVTTRSTILCLQVGKDTFPGIKNREATDFLLNGVMDTEPIRKAFFTMAEVYFSKKPFFEMKMISLASEVFHSIFTACPTRALTADEEKKRENRNARLKRLEHFVEEHYREKIKLSDFAAMEKRSLSFMSHFVKESLNQTFQEYVEEVRFHSACEMILRGEEKLLDVCVDAGFSDYRFFSRAFKKHCAMTPEQFKKASSQMVADDAMMRQNIHSVEQRYTSEQSLKLLKSLIEEK